MYLFAARDIYDVSRFRRFYGHTSPRALFAELICLSADEFHRRGPRSHLAIVTTTTFYPSRIPGVMSGIADDLVRRVSEPGLDWLPSKMSVTEVWRWQVGMNQAILQRHTLVASGRFAARIGSS